MAETEKYAHVTFFFNGGREAPFDGERRVLVPSPQHVPTYDQAPEMSAEGVRDAVVRGLAAGEDELLVVNFANADMVGHTGVVEAAVRGIETVDACMADIRAAVAAAGGLLCVTADHGNSEVMIEPDGSPNTAHTSNPVPLWIDRPGLTLREGGALGRRRAHPLRAHGLGPGAVDGGDAAALTAPPGVAPSAGAGPCRRRRSALSRR